MNPLAIPLDVTLFADRAAGTAEQRRLSLLELERMALDTRAPDKAALPLIKLATFGGQRTTRGSLRSNANVERVTGVEADYDAGQLGIEGAGALLRAAGIAAVLYTSPSHMPDFPRWRVLCPLARPHAPEDRAELVARLNGALGGVLAVESFTLSQTFYIGQTTGATAPATLTVPGEPLDELPGLAPTFPARRAAEPIPLPAPLPGQEPDTYVRAAREKAFAAFDTSDNRHHTLLAVTAALAPMVLSGHLDRDELVVDIQAAMSTSGRDANPAEVEAALDGVLRLHGLRPYAPRSDGIEFPPLPLPPASPIRKLFVSRDYRADPNEPYIIKGLMKPGNVGVLLGHPGAAKSTLAAYLAFAVVQGRRVFGMRTRPGRVLMLAAEDAHGTRKRVGALGQRFGHTDDCAVMTCGNLLEPDELATVRATIAEFKPALVILDTIAAAFAGFEENASQDMGQVIRFARGIAVSGCAVLLVHHPAKAGDGSPRGHSSLNGTLDWSVTLAPDDVSDPDTLVRAKCPKNRNGTTALGFAFRKEVVVLGHDADGDRITTTLPVEVADEDAKAAKPVRLSPAEAAALALLPADGPADAADWLAACAERSTAMTAKDKGRSARVVRSRLLDKGLIRVESGNVFRGMGEQAEFPPSSAPGWSGVLD